MEIGSNVITIIKKTHGLPPASWRARKASVVTQPEGLETRGLLVKGPGSKGLRTRSSDVQGQEKINIPAQEKRGRKNVSILHLLVLPRPSGIG